LHGKCGNESFKSIIWNRVAKIVYVGYESLSVGISYAVLTVEGIRFQVLTAVGTKMAVFWVVAPCSLIEIYQHFRGPCCLQHQGDDGGSKVL
jgi:hypothetical protein